MISYHALILFTNCLMYLVIHYYQSSNLPNMTLIPYNVIEKGEYGRLIFNCICHGSLQHLIFNMNAVINIVPILSTLNIDLKKILFLLFILYNIVYIFLAYILHFYFNFYSIYYRPVIGFSGILFGLMYIYSYILPYRVMNIMGINILNKYSPYLILLISQMMGNNISFLGHLSGIIAGYLTSYILGY